MKPDVIIAGAGVTGLTTGVVLLEAGFRVKILAREFSPDTTSDIAAAIWFPFQAEPQNKVEQWSRISYERFETLCEIPSSGVSLVDYTLLFPEKIDKIPWWAKFLSPERIRKPGSTSIPKGYKDAFTVVVPLIETQIYMPFLHNRFERLGGTMEKKEIKSLKTIQEKSGLLINCAGLGSAKLASDPEVFPIGGQIVKIEKIPDVACMGDDHGVNALSYILPRKDCIVLGGTAVKGQNNTSPDHGISMSILEKCMRLEPNLAGAKIINSQVGLRPGRSSIRLESDKETGIIHNYGHGGSGFTVSWGCAMEILALAEYNISEDLTLK